MKKKIISFLKPRLALLLAVAMLISMMPLSAFAAETTVPETTWESQVTGSFTEAASTLESYTHYSVVNGEAIPETVTIDTTAALGSKENPIAISSPEELILFGQIVTWGQNRNPTYGKYYILTQDTYDMGGHSMLALSASVYFPSGGITYFGFYGTLIGNGATICNASIVDGTRTLYYENMTIQPALFSALNGRIWDLTMDNCTVSGSSGGMGMLYAGTNGLDEDAIINCDIVDGQLFPGSGTTSIKLLGSTAVNSQADVTLGCDYTLAGNLTLNSGEILTIPEGVTLTVPAGRTLTLESGASLINNGKLLLTEGGSTVNNGGTATCGENSGHAYLEDVCQICGNGCAHAGDATCAEQVTCTLCGKTYQPAHTLNEAGDACAVCGAVLYSVTMPGDELRFAIFQGPDYAVPNQDYVGTIIPDPEWNVSHGYHYHFEVYVDGQRITDFSFINTQLNIPAELVTGDILLTCTGELEKVLEDPGCGVYDCAGARSYEQILWAADYRSAEIILCCGFCDDTWTRTVDATVLEYTAATCTAAGKGIYRIDYLDISETKEVDYPIDPNAHNYEGDVCTRCGGKQYPIYLGGVQVTDTNASDILGDGTASYDAQTNTLTLNGAAVDASALIVPALEITGGTVTLALQGTNALTGSLQVQSSTDEEGNTTWYGEPAISIAEGAALIITGDETATLTLMGNDFAYTANDHIPSASAITGGSLTVSGGQITTENGIRLSGAYIQDGGSMKAGFIEAANVTVSKGALESLGDSGISVRYMDPNAGGIHGIFANETITVSGGTVTSSSGTVGHNGDYCGTHQITGETITTHGLYALESIRITGGSVTSTGCGGGYVIGDMGELVMGSYKDGETLAGPLPGSALEAPQWSISEEATFTCGSNTSHRGGTATCTLGASCGFCGEAYGETDPSNHDTVNAGYTNGFCNVCDAYEAAELVDGVYQIGNAGQLYWFAQQVNSGSFEINAVLTADITINENVLVNGTLNTDTNVVSQFRIWSPIGIDYDHKYQGTFDGQNHTVSGIYINDQTVGNVGLFGNTGGTVKNLGITDSYFKGNRHVGTVAGGNTGTIENCYNTGMIAYGAQVGGVAGGNYGTVINCRNEGRIAASSNAVGGVVGCNFGGQVVKCFNTGAISGHNSVGGIVGSNDATVENCGNTGSVATTESYRVGGVVGINNGIVNNCYNTGTVTGKDFLVGGVVGRNSKTVTNCFYLTGCAKDEKNTVQFGIGTDTLGSTAADVAGVTTGYSDFSTGEVCYLLNNGITDGTQAWYQTIGEDAAPLFSGQTVYYGYPHCADTTAKYSNTVSYETPPPHDYIDNGFCVCGACQPAAKNDNGFYEIGNAGQLVWFSDLVNRGNPGLNAVLTADIDMDGITSYTPMCSTALYYNGDPAADGDWGYTGTFDGQGYVIHNLSLTGSATDTLTYGLFGTLSGTVKNLGMENFTFADGGKDCRAGSVVGQILSGGLVLNCYALNCTLEVVNGSSGYIAGGIAGCNYGGTIRNCFVRGCTVTGHSRCAALVADCRGDISETDRPGNVINCFSDSTLAGSQSVASYIVDCESKVAADRFASGEIAYRLGEGWGQTLEQDASPILNGDPVYRIDNTGCHYQGSFIYSNDPDAIFAPDHSFGEGSNGFCTNILTDGTVCDAYQPAPRNADGAYEIGNAGQLYWFAALTNSGEYTADAVLTDDIVVNENVLAEDGTLNEGTYRTWTPIRVNSKTGNYSYLIEPYCGTFDGQGHSISGLYYQVQNAFVGLIGCVGESGIVRNLGIRDTYIKSLGCVGAVAGRNKGTVTGCYNAGYITTGNASPIGGVVGRNDGTVTDCYNAGTVDAVGCGSVGGVVGLNYGTVMRSYNAGSVTGLYQTGGVVGHNRETGTVKNCYNTTPVTITNSDLSQVGGIVGQNSDSATISNCYNTGFITPVGDYYGGIVGRTDAASTVTNCYYLDTCGAAGTGTSRTAAQFASGQVAYEMNGSVSDGDLAWYQNLDNGQTVDALPKLSGGTVYYGYGDCQATIPYTNNGTNASDTPIAHSYDANGFCANLLADGTAVCGDYQPAEQNGDGVYEIDNAGKLYWFAQQVNTGSTKINGKLTKDIVINENLLDALTIDTEGRAVLSEGASEPRPWTPIGSTANSYAGAFDGNGYTISGLYMNGEQDNAGLFGYAATAFTLTNLKVLDSYLHGRGNVGGIIGYCYSTVTGVSFDGVVCGMSNVGGIVGQCYGTVIGSSFDGAAYSSLHAGGIVGWLDGSVERCSSSGDVYGTSVGGIVGGTAHRSPIVSCYNTGNVTADIQGGGILGNGEATLTNCYNTGTVTGDAWIGGILGFRYNGTITDCYYLSGCAVADGTAQTGIGIEAGEAPVADVAGSCEAKTAAEFTGGAVAWLLNGSTSTPAEGKTLIWYQNLNNGQTPDAAPVQDSTHGTVYHGYTSCAANAELTYTNYTQKPEHINEDAQVDHYCDVCGDMLTQHQCDDQGVCDICGQVFEVKSVWNGGEAYLSSLAEALNGWGSASEHTLVLLKDVTVEYDYFNISDRTVDLNGHTWDLGSSTLYNTDRLPDMFLDNIVTITDSVGGGKLITTASFALCAGSDHRLALDRVIEIESAKADIELYGNASILITGPLSTGAYSVVADAGQVIAVPGEGVTLDPAWFVPGEVGYLITANEDGTLSYTKCTHDWAWQQLEDTHERTCSICGMYESGEHADEIRDHLCDTCGKQISDHDLITEVNWYPYPDSCSVNVYAACTGCDLTAYEGGDAEQIDSYEGTNCQDPSWVTYSYTYTFDEVQYTLTKTFIIRSDNHIGFDDNGFCTACDGYEKPQVDPGEDPEWDYDDVYLIYNAGQLYWFADYVNNVSNGITGKLMANIDLNPGFVFNADGSYSYNGIEGPFAGGIAGLEPPRMWTPIGSGSPCYAGNFDGNGFTVSGAYALSEGSYVGLFGNTDYNYIIENLGVTNSYFKGADYVGGLIGYAYTIVKNCYVTDTVYVSGNHTTAALVGYNGGEINNCYAMADTLVDSGRGTVTNSFYLAEEEIDSDEGTTALTAEDFASGKVAYLLQSGIVGEEIYDEETDSYITLDPEHIWGQTIGEDAYPVLYGQKVYQMVDCQNVPHYGNTEGSDGHSWTDATCTEPKTCDLCGATEGEALGHTEETVPGYAATCTETGLTDGVVCTVCGETIAAQEEIAALGHTEGETTEDILLEPGCAYEGEKQVIVYCATCGGEISNEIVSIPATGHTEQTVSGSAPTCTDWGWTDGVECAVCGEILVEQEILPKADHSYGDDDTCDNCGYVYTPVVLRYPTVAFRDEIVYNIYYSVEGMENVSSDRMGLLIFDGTNPNATIDDAITVVPGATLTDDGLMVSSYGIPAKNMGDNMYFRIYVQLEDGSYVYSHMGVYNAVSYAKSIVYGEYSDSMKALVVAMLNYGAQAQLYFGYQTDSLMNSWISEEDQARVGGYDASTIAPIVRPDSSKVGTFAATGGFARMYPTVSFEGAFSINYYFTPANTVTGDVKLYYWTAADYSAAQELTADNATGVLTMTGAGEFQATVANIAAKDLDKTVYVAAVYSDGTTTYCSGVLAYSIGAYCASQAAKATSLQAFAEATAVYATCAKSYFGEA